jgi:hypothetical protein
VLTSASHVDNATVLARVEDHAIGPPFNIIRMPMVDRLVSSLAKSESAKV